MLKKTSQTLTDCSEQAVCLLSFQTKMRRCHTDLLMALFTECCITLVHITSNQPESDATSFHSHSVEMPDFACSLSSAVVAMFCTKGVLPMCVQATACVRIVGTQKAVSEHGYISR